MTLNTIAGILGRFAVSQQVRAGCVGVIAALALLASACDGDDFSEPASSPPSIEGTPTATATVGTLWSYGPTLGGKPQPIVSLMPGAPAWLSVSGGEVRGTPTNADVGSNTFTIVATNGLPPVATQSVTVNVIPIAGPPTITGTPLSSVQIGTQWTYAPTVIGNPVPTLTFDPGAPTWLSISGFTISGTPTVADLGQHTFTIRAANGSLPDATQTIGLTVIVQALVPPSIGGNHATSGVAGSQWSFTPSLTGNPAPTLSIDAGAPSWVQASGGTVQGTPTAANIGINTFTIRASNGVNPDATRAISVNVTPTPVPPQFTSAAPTTAVEGFPFIYAPTLTGSPTPVLSLAPGAPTWLTVVPAEGRVEGTPTMEDFGPVTFTLLASNGANPQASQVVTLDVVGPFSPLTDQGQPSDRVSHSIVWSGSRFLVWGGTSATTSAAIGSGTMYDPATDSWFGMTTSGAPTARRFHTAIWTGTRMIIWGGASGSAVPLTTTPLATGAMFDPATNTWTTMSTTNAPSARFNHGAVWTGTHMIVWGGQNAAGPLGSGAVFDPATNTWATMTTTGAPSARSQFSAVWDDVGGRMIVWGGIDTSQTPAELRGNGARYHLATDSWTPVSNNGAPSPRMSHFGVWTGSRMIIWGGTTGGSLSWPIQGGIYNPVGNSWTRTTLTNSPATSNVLGSTAVWTGDRMLVWGGSVFGLGSYYSRLGSYFDPVANAWETRRGPLLENSLSCSFGWDQAGGRLMIYGSELVDGLRGIYTVPSASTPSIPAKVASLINTTSTGAEVGVPFTFRLAVIGRPLPTLSLAPGSPSWLSVVGDELQGTPTIGDVGTTEVTVIATNGIGQPGEFVLDLKVIDRTVGWTALPTAGGPAAANDARAVWTGRAMAVWTGASNNSEVPRLLTLAENYDTVNDEVTDRWQGGVPNFARVRGSSMIWTGDKVLVWGGMRLQAPLEPTDLGAWVNPSDVTYSRTTQVGAPEPRHRHSAVWTGSQMIIFGGSPESATGNNINSGGVYHVANDTWSATSTAGAPSGRAGHTAVWTGSRMLVWGGYQTVAGNGPLGDGASYDPVTDTWTPISATGAPAARSGHTAIWTGTSMIIWGGTGTGGALGDGAIYDPVGNSWTPIPAGGASPRVGHSAVWTGNTMIVWGGWTGSGGNLNSGGIFDPVAGTWAATSTSSPPTGRREHVAVWTGNRMIIWGGTGGAGALNSGAVLKFP